MISGTDHTVLAVYDIEQGIQQWSSITGRQPDHTVRGTDSDLHQAFFTLPDNTFIELIAPSNEQSQLAAALQKRGEGVHVLALATDDIEQTVLDLESNGVRLIGKDSQQVFIHPDSASGVLVQLWPSDRPHRWRDSL